MFIHWNVSESRTWFILVVCKITSVKHTAARGNFMTFITKNVRSIFCWKSKLVSTVVYTVSRSKVCLPHFWQQCNWYTSIFFSLAIYTARISSSVMNATCSKIGVCLLFLSTCVKCSTGSTNPNYFYRK